MDRSYKFQTTRRTDVAAVRKAYPYTGWVEPTAAGDTILWGSWVEHKSERYCMPITIPPCCSGSDYSGTLLERSNAKVFADAHSTRVVHITGGHGTFGVAYIGFPTKAIRASVDALNDYPCLDESDWSELEMESQDEAWNDYGRDDFRRELLERLNARCEELQLPEWDDVSNRVCDDLWYQFCQQDSGYEAINEEGDSWYFRTDDCIAWLTDETFCRVGLLPWDPADDTDGCTDTAFLALLESSLRMLASVSNLTPVGTPRHIPGADIAVDDSIAMVLSSLRLLLTGFDCGCCA